LDKKKERKQRRERRIKKERCEAEIRTVKSIDLWCPIFYETAPLGKGKKGTRREKKRKRESIQW